MKRILLIICLLLVTVGCTNIKKMDYKDIINNTIRVNSNNKNYNRYLNGYKYYLPKNMSVKDSLNFNEKITSGDNTYYLYLDIVSYYNKVTPNLKSNNNFINYKFNYNNNIGILNVTEVNDKYLVEIIYNYAKIEVRVSDYDLNEAINNSIIILSTLRYDKDIIGKLVGEDNLGSEEELLEIFENNANKDNFIDIIEEYDNYEEENDIPDYDVIN